MATDGSRTVETVAGFVGALAILAALVWIVGVGDLLDALSRARPRFVLAVVLAAAVWLAAWALALRTVLGALSVHISISGVLAVYAGVLFANNVTPFGQAGGEPISALLISDTTGTEYETALAAIASADSLNVVPSTVLALVGVVYLSAVRAVGDIAWAVATVLFVAVALPVLVGVGWRYRHRLEAGVVGVVTPLARTVGRRLPRATAPGVEAVERRVDGFFRSIEVVAGDRRRLLAAVGLSTLGWLAQVAALWLSLQAVGATGAGPGAVLVAVPVGAIAGVTPLPGGLGGIEAALVALLVPLAGVAAPTAAAAVVLHRGAIYWLPTLGGGGVVSALGASRI